MLHQRKNNATIFNVFAVLKNRSLTLPRFAARPDDVSGDSLPNRIAVRNRDSYKTQKQPKNNATIFNVFAVLKNRSLTLPRFSARSDNVFGDSLVPPGFPLRSNCATARPGGLPTYLDELRPSRKPKLSTRREGPQLYRKADRQLPARLTQLPPR